MTDREMLELAAKAAGVFLTPKTLAETFPKWEWCSEFEPYHLEDGGMIGTVIVYGFKGELSGTTSQTWNPLDDDGDALRLAVKLRLDVEWLDRETVFVSSAQRVAHDDPYAAIRRAIVIAAAEIGKNMETK